MFKERKEYPLNKLKVGTTFQLFKTNWIIKEIGEYDWRMDNSSVEYTIQSEGKKAFLEVEYAKGEYEIIFSEEAIIEEAFLEHAIRDKEIYFEDGLYELEETYTGTYKNITTLSDSESLESNMFYHKKSILTIEKWSDNSFEAFVGIEVNPKKIKNIKIN